MKFIIIGILTLTLSNCDNAQMSSQRARPIIVSQCPELAKYKTADLKRAAKELNLLPANSQIAELLTDYNKLRDACRVLSNRMRLYY